MTNKTWACVGAGYATFAIILAVASVSPLSENSSHKTQGVADSSESPTVYHQRLPDNAWGAENSRRDYFLTIWSTRNCASCVQQEAEIPALEAAGYNVILRKVPAPRFVKSFPTTVVTKERLNGERVAVVTGFNTLAEFDKILGIEAEEEEGEEEGEDEDKDEDYDIFTPMPTTSATQMPRNYNLIVWLSHSEICDKQYLEIVKLKAKGFNANIYMRPLPQRVKTPIVILIDNRRRRPRVVMRWYDFVTAEEVLNVVS